MKKIVKICDKEYTMKSSAFTQFKYKNDTGRGLLQDVKKISEMQTDGMGVLEDLDQVLEIVLRIAYVMIEEADPKQVTSFEQFLRDSENLFEDEGWINDVIELAITPLSRGNQKNPQ